MSNQYGLGADNILEIEVVLPSGNIVTINANSYPDLFWAHRGGGASTFGVVTKLTYKTHPFLSQNALRIVITPGLGDHASYTKGMAYFMSKMPEFVDFGMTGYPIMFPAKYECLFTAPGKTWDEITTFVEPIGEKLKDTYGLSVSSIPIESSINALMGSMGITANPDTTLKSGNAVMSSRLISRTAALNSTAWEQVLSILFSQGYILEPFPVVGGQVSKNKDMDMSLNPAWRTAVMHFSILDVKSDSYTKLDQVNRGYKKMMSDGLPLIDAISVDRGAYLNEVR